MGRFNKLSSVKPPINMESPRQETLKVRRGIASRLAYSLLSRACYEWLERLRRSQNGSKFDWKLDC